MAFLQVKGVVPFNKGWRSLHVTKLLFDAPGDEYKRLWFIATKDSRLGYRNRILKNRIDDHQLLGFGKTKRIFYGFNRILPSTKVDFKDKNHLMSSQGIMSPRSSNDTYARHISTRIHRAKVLPWFMQKKNFGDQTQSSKQSSTSLKGHIKNKGSKTGATSTHGSYIGKAALEDDEKLLGKNNLRHMSRGWNSRSMEGKSLNFPLHDEHGIMEEFDSTLLEIHKTNVKHGTTYKYVFRAFVAVGNGKGIIGYAYGDAINRMDAIVAARNNAIKCLYRVALTDGHTIIHRVRCHMNNVILSVDPRPDGYGLRCNRIVRSICKLAGIKNLHARLLGTARRPVSIIQATIQALATQENHDELAERTGCYVVSVNASDFNLPQIIAAPSTQAILEGRAKRKQAYDYSFSIPLDPYLGLHRPKRVQLHDRTTVRWKLGRPRMRNVIKHVLHGRRY